MRPLPLALIVLVVFGAFSVRVILQQGYFGFVTLAGREPWALQMLIDLALSLVLAGRWLVLDARKRGLSPWPWLVGSVAVGSLSPLAYVVYRELAGRKEVAGAGAVASR